MSVLRRVPIVLAALSLGGTSAWALTACGSSDNGAKIPSGDAAAITEALDRAKEDFAGGDCEGAAQQVQSAKDAALSLNAQVDRKLRENINEGIRNLQTQVPEDCNAETVQETVETQTTPETTTTETVPTVPTETQTTPTTETQTTPTETLPTEPTPPEEIPIPTTPEDTGGVTPEDGFE